MSWTGLIAVVVLFGLPVWWAAVKYNGLVSLRNRFKNAFSQIDVQLKRRYDLIPNLVEVAKGYLAHERGTLEAVTAARGAAVGANARAAANPADAAAISGLSAAEAGLSGALGRLMAVVEAYPDLRGNETMVLLTEELAGTENKVAFARQAFNDAVMHYNTAAESFPANIVAAFFQFKHAELLDATESAAEREAPKVSFG
jgi:LemA protein